MIDRARLRSIYEQMSDDEIAHSFAQGSDQFLPETWSMIEEQLASRGMQVVPEEILPALPPPEIEADTTMPLTERDRLKRGATTAYALAALYAVSGTARLIRHGAPILIVLCFALAVVLGIAGVRMNRRQSVRAAAIALGCTSLVVAYGLYRSLELEPIDIVLTVLVAAAPIYLLLDALTAARALRIGETPIDDPITP